MKRYETLRRFAVPPWFKLPGNTGVTYHSQQPSLRICLRSFGCVRCLLFDTGRFCNSECHESLDTFRPQPVFSRLSATNHAPCGGFSLHQRAYFGRHLPVSRYSTFLLRVLKVQTLHWCITKYLPLLTTPLCYNVTTVSVEKIRTYGSCKGKLLICNWRYKP